MQHIINIIGQTFHYAFSQGFFFRFGESVRLFLMIMCHGWYSHPFWEHVFHTFEIIFLSAAKSRTLHVENTRSWQLSFKYLHVCFELWMERGLLYFARVNVFSPIHIHIHIHKAVSGFLVLGVGLSVSKLCLQIVLGFVKIAFPQVEFKWRNGLSQPSDKCKLFVFVLVAGIWTTRRQQRWKLDFELHFDEEMHKIRDNLSHCEGYTWERQGHDLWKQTHMYALPLCSSEFPNTSNVVADMCATHATGRVGNSVVDSPIVILIWLSTCGGRKVFRAQIVHRWAFPSCANTCYCVTLKGEAWGVRT